MISPTLSVLAYEISRRLEYIFFYTQTAQYIFAVFKHQQRNLYLCEAHSVQFFGAPATSRSLSIVLKYVQFFGACVVSGLAPFEWCVLLLFLVLLVDPNS